jgi:uncharacterized protein (DUF1697 family)
VATHVALLRGINLGSRNRVAMPALRELVSSLGHSEVRTYIQSGNVLFTSGERDEQALAETIERAIARELGVSCRVIVASRKRLAQLARDNPYPQERNQKAVHAIFFSEEPGGEFRDRLKALQRRFADEGSRDSARLVGRTLFLHTPDGYGRSKLAAALIREDGSESPRATGTARNWATVTKLIELCE